MMNLAEFTILGRVGKIKPFEGKTSVTICANYLPLPKQRRREGKRRALERGDDLLRSDAPSPASATRAISSSQGVG